MNVAKLIAELSTYPPEADVYIMIPGDESVGIWPTFAYTSNVRPEYDIDDDDNQFLCGVLIEGEI